MCEGGGKGRGERGRKGEREGRREGGREREGGGREREGGREGREGGREGEGGRREGERKERGRIKRRKEVSTEVSSKLAICDDCKHARTAYPYEGNLT